MVAKLNYYEVKYDFLAFYGNEVQAGDPTKGLGGFTINEG